MDEHTSACPVNRGWGPGVINDRQVRAPLRFLFVMQYPGYLRYFDSVVRLLADRGHHVDLVFDSPHKQPEGVEALAGFVGDIEWLDRTPTRGDVWGPVGRAIRGTVDYLRYLDPRFADARYLRDRMRKALPPLFRFVGRWETASARATRGWVGLFLRLERAIPSSQTLEHFIRSRHADAVLVTPLVTDRCPQVDMIKSAQALGVPTALCVASWDHLTTKGLMRIQPDLVAVWNEEQKAEALEFHGAQPAQVLVTGAHPFDRWFERRPTERAAFCRKVGLPADKPFVLFVGSTQSISAPTAEVGFVRRWLEALRREPALRDVSILIRPHPYNSAHWGDVDLSAVAGVTVYPRSSNPVNEADRQDYFDSLYHSETVVGINTTAMVEAAIVGRTVHSVLADEFKGTQGGTLHFRYLLSENGGFLRVATSLAEHVCQIVETIETPGIGRERCARFTAAFVRPRGGDVAAAPLLVEALERLAASGRRAPVRPPAWAYPLRLVMWIAGGIAVYRDTDRLRRAVRKSASIRAEQMKHLMARWKKAKRAPVGGARSRSETDRRKAG